MVSAGLAFVACLVISPWMIVYQVKTGRAGFTSHPIPSLTTGSHRLRPEKIVKAWYGTESGRFKLPLATIQIPWMLVYTFAGACALRNWRRSPPEILLCYGLVISAWCVSVATFAVIRFLEPVFPFAVFSICWHAQNFWCRHQERNERK